MPLSVIVVGLFGVFSLIGGVIGYVKAKSAVSFMAGSVSGLILLACAAGLMRGSVPAAWASLLIAILLSGRFLGTWIRTRRLMPDALMVGFGLATFIAVSLWLRAH